MKQLFSLLLLCCMNLVSAQRVESPTGTLALTFQLTPDGQPTYAVSYKNKPVVLSSALGVSLKDKTALVNHFEVTGTTTHAVNETWKTGIGRTSPNREPLQRIDCSFGTERFKSETQFGL